MALTDMIKGLNLIVNPKNTDEYITVMNQVPAYIGNFHSTLADTITRVTDKNADNQRVVRNKTIYKLTKLENKKIHVESESYEYFTVICAFLNDKGIDYVLSELSIEYMFHDRLEDIAVLYTKEFPGTAINESMFIRRKTPCPFNCTKLKFTFGEKHLQEATVTAEAILNSLYSCEPMYPSRGDDDVSIRNGRSIFTAKDDISSINFNEEVMQLFMEDLQELIHLFNTIDADSIYEFVDIMPLKIKTTFLKI